MERAMSRIFDALRRAEAGRTRAQFAEPAAARAFRVVSVTSNKGGVGKTTIATNLAVYLRALREGLPVLFLGLDDQTSVNRMFSLQYVMEGGTIASALRVGSLAGAIRLGQYGVHFVPASPAITDLKREITDPLRLRSLLERSGWRGVVVIDTKSDFEILTRNALAASDLSLVVVKDQASLLEAQRVFDWLRHRGEPAERARVVLSLVDRRVKYADAATPDVLALLRAEVHRLGYPAFEAYLSRSPTIEALLTNPDGRSHSILNAAPTSIVHRQMTRLAQEVLDALRLDSLGEDAAQTGVDR
jgi:cellulose biosynthesis protein BcsQ